MLFDGWSGIVRTLLIGTLAYVAMVFMLRVSGKRTLSKMNAFDFIVTVALGSALANVLLDEGVALAEGATAFALLIGLQYLVTWSSVRAPWVKRFVTGEPELVAYRGRLLDDALRRTRVTEDEVRAAVRNQGHGDLGTPRRSCSRPTAPSAWSRAPTAPPRVPWRGCAAGSGRRAARRRPGGTRAAAVRAPPQESSHVTAPASITL
jgi:hypothetical protein